MIAIGLMSGTSLDGIDAARVRVVPRGERYDIALEAFETVPFSNELRDRIIAAMPPHATSALEIAHLHALVGEAFADAAARVATRWTDYIASHGLTLAHDGDAHVTMQIGDPFRIRERFDTTVISDFRSADTAAGGHGAPLVPHVDALLFASEGEPRVALNLGGIANVSVLQAGSPLIAFDTGPGNMTLDAFIVDRTGGAERFDRDGNYARAGRINEPLLHAMLADRYFAKPPPKTTGRERFGPVFLARYRTEFDALSLPDGAATLTALTIRTVADAIQIYARSTARLIVGGGGAHNFALLDGLRRALPRIAIVTSDAFGIDPDAREAIAFAVLGYECLRGRAAGVPKVTGARGPRVLGSIAPHDLESLFARVARECQGRSR